MNGLRFVMLTALVAASQSGCASRGVSPIAGPFIANRVPEQVLLASYSAAHRSPEDDSDDSSEDEELTKPRREDTQPWDEDAERETFASLTIDEAVAMAEANNPTLAQAAASVRRIQAQRAQVGFYPNPVLGYVASNVGDDQTAGEHGAFFSQTFVTANKLELNRAVATGDMAAAQAVYQSQRLRVSTGVQQLFYDALAAQLQVDAARRLESVADEGLSITKSRHEDGKTSRGDLLQAEVVLNRAGISTARAEIEATAAWRRLAAAMGTPDLSPRRMVGQLGPSDEQEDLDEIDFERLWIRLQSNSPELNAASARIARAEAQMSRERAEAVPNLDLQGQLQHDFTSSQALGSFQVGMALPVHHRNQGAIAAAVAEHQRALSEYRRVELELRDRLAVTVGEAATAGRRIGTYKEEILPKAEESLRLIQQQYDDGETDLLRLLTAQESYAAALVDLIQFEADWRRAWVSIEGLLLTQSLAAPTSVQSPGSGAGLTGVSRSQ